MRARCQSEGIGPMNSSSSESLQTLAQRVHARRAETFLQELLNLRTDDERACAKFNQRFSDLMPMHLSFLPNELFPPYASTDAPPISPTLLASMTRDYLAEVWGAPTVFAREITLMRFVGAYLHTEEPRRHLTSRVMKYNQEYWAKEAASHVDTFLLVLLKALHIVDRMRYCPNPECPAPYFIAKRRSQKYCSDACALPAQREFKRAWWSDHGNEWRAKRAKKPRSAKARRQTRRSQGKRGN